MRTVCATATIGGHAVENSSEGPVTQTLDVFPRIRKIAILEGFSMPVRHHLLADRALRRPEAIERVYSHPQALGSVVPRCVSWCRRPSLLAESSTAAAARRVATESGSAAVATLAAARVYRLAVIARDLQDSAANVTRFS